MQSSIKFFTNKRPASVADANSENQYNRGIIQITIPSVENHDVSSLTPSSSSPIRQKIRVIMYASIDCSGSMSDVATCYTNQQRSRDQRQQSTKMNFVHATLNNMVETIISQQEEFSHVEFYLALVKFHSTATCVLHPQRVTPESKDEILQIISRIVPLNGTNFEKCFKEMANLISNESRYILPSSDIPEHCVQRMHVFLTDGENNEGNKSISYLAGLLGGDTRESAASQPTQIMIGYGTDHDSATLQSLCSYFPNSRQWFVDDIEKTGCIFGEILWSSVNAAFTKVSINTNSAEVYDFETMKWKNEIYLGDFAYESSRTYYVRMPWEQDELICNFKYTSIDTSQYTSCNIVTPINYTSTEQETIDLEAEKELWRLDTIITIDKSIQFFKTIRRMTFQDQVSEKARLVDEITAFQEKFLKYATERNLLEDPYIIQLADDLFVCINGLAVTSIGEKYIAARQASQIQQRAVTINDITPLQRQIIDSIPIEEDEVASSMQAVRTRTSSFTSGIISSEMFTQNDDDDMLSTCTPVRRARSSYVGCVDNDTPMAAPAPAPAPTSTRIQSEESEPKTPNTPMGCVTPNTSASTDDNVVSQTQEKILSDLTPSSRGIGSNLRFLTRDAIIGMRKSRARGYARCKYGDSIDEEDDDGEYYSNDFMDSCGGDETFSSHASPGCARIGRMLSAPTPSQNPIQRVATTPF